MMDFEELAVVAKWDYVELAEELAEAKTSLEFAQAEFDRAKQAYMDAEPPRGEALETGEWVINYTKDTVRRAFSKDKMIAVYGKAEYDRFTEEKPQAGHVRISKAKDGGF